MKRVEAAMHKFDFLFGLVIGALGMFGIMLVIMLGLNQEHDANQSNTAEIPASACVTEALPTSAPTPSPTPTPELTIAPSESSLPENIDLPAGLTSSDFDYCTESISGEGTFTIVDNTLVKYVDGERIDLKGGALNWAGIDLNNYMPYENELLYNKDDDTLFLITATMPKETDTILARVKEENDVLTPAEKKLVDGIGVYLYVIPDYNVSEMQFVGQITGYIDSGSFFYRDTNNVFWEYEKQDNTYSFIKIAEMYGPTQFADEHKIFWSLNPCFVFSPFYGYYCCGGNFCHAESCKDCCDCKNCS